MLLPIVLGAVAGGLFVLIARRWKHPGEPRLMATGLVVAALIYGGFAVAGAADPRWLGLEAAGLGLFGVVAWLGLRVSPWWLALGWAAHAAWDVVHLDRAQGFVPAWYSLWCFALDLVVAGYLLGPATARRADRTEAP
jgi:hypothetical protein